MTNGTFSGINFNNSVNFNNVSGGAYNRFVNLDGSEDRIIYHLLSPNNKSPEQLRQTHIIWKLLCYPDIDAMLKPLPKYSDVVKLICNDNTTQTNFRIFRSPHFEDGWIEQCTLLKVYVDSIIPQNNMIATVNYGIDIIAHNKTINVTIPDDDPDNLCVSNVIDVVNGIEVKVSTKSRVTMLTQAVLALLNGADIAGVGPMQFNMNQSRYNQAQYGIWNNRNFEGMKVVLGATMSGVSSDC